MKKRIDIDCQNCGSYTLASSTTSDVNHIKYCPFCGSDIIETTVWATMDLGEKEDVNVVKITEKKAGQLVDCLIGDMETILNERGLGETERGDTVEYALAEYLRNKIDG